MRFIRKDTETEGAGLPLTSLIDVVFLLLIFFMVTSVLTPTESQLASTLRSEEKTRSSAVDFQPQIVEVTQREGRPVFVMGQRVMTSKAELTELLDQLPKEGGVFIKADSPATVGGVAAAQQAAKDSGFTRITYVPGA